MRILQLRKYNKCCHECGDGINRLDLYAITDRKIMHLYCAKIRRLHNGAVWWIKNKFLGEL